MQFPPLFTPCPTSPLTTHLPPPPAAMVELRDAFLQGLHLRRSEGRRQACTLMVAVTLMQHVNDSPSDAEALARLLAPIVEAGFKVCVDLIPYNDIGIAAVTGTAVTESAKTAQGGSAGQNAFEAALATPLNPLSPPGTLLAGTRISRAHHSRVNDFQAVVRAAGLACFVRVTRGDDQSAACGQLATTTAAAAMGASP